MCAVSWWTSILYISLDNAESMYAPHFSEIELYRDNRSQVRLCRRVLRYDGRRDQRAPSCILEPQYARHVHDSMQGMCMMPFSA